MTSLCPSIVVTTIFLTLLPNQPGIAMILPSDETWAATAAMANSASESGPLRESDLGGIGESEPLRESDLGGPGETALGG